MVNCSTCHLCGADAKQKCSGCLSVVYCSKEHQKLDWKAHKENCSCYEVEEDETLGRCLVARRDVRPGEVVLRERPLVSGPAQVTGPVCLGCHNALSCSGLVCPRCGWPVCSAACAESPRHRPECHWATLKRKEKVRITNFSTPHPTYACITALRALYTMRTDPVNGKKLASLESHRSRRQEDGKWEQERFAVAQLLRRFYRLEAEVSEEEILDICGVIQINGHEIPLSEPGHISVYWRCSLLEHSCRPNCSKSFSDGGEVVIRAAQPVLRGEHLSICYTDPLWGTPSRLHHLQLTKYFSCRCARCQDPTEMGTYFSAINCPNSECKGKLLPKTFFESNSHWTCTQCENAMSPEDVTSILAHWAEELARTDKTSPGSCEQYLRRSSSQLSEHHYHRTEVKLALAQLLGQASGGLASLSARWLQVKERLARELLAFSALLIPAECRIRGILFFELHAAVAEGARREAQQASGELSVPARLLESRKYLEKCIELLKYEPMALPEGRVCKQANDNFKDLDKLLKSMNVSILGGL